ncbi:GNAT family N-acetyltransferase [Occallatibacter savannae]|uniref:GNAT family N-acetyltransferase n=1 Tax=Occallatibacter savannae TaxID=1002691 RepID=UPI000D68E0BF|nr:GNAT family N-acetyltransferase [Occallatibacter savannae]
MISIRAARPGDAVAIAHVHVESWRSTYAGIVPDEYLAGLDESLRVKLWQEWLGSGAVVLVAERKSEIVGFVHAGKIREPIETADAEIYSLYLLRDAQGRGIGRALLTELSTSLDSQGFSSLGLWVLERNRSRGFYENCGGRLSASKVIEIGGARLMEVAYWWPDLASLRVLS